MPELIPTEAVESFGSLFSINSFRDIIVADAAIFQSKIIDITDPISDPANPLPDFGNSLNITFTRDWVLAWSVRLNLTDIVPSGWAGTNRSMLFVTVLDFPTGNTVSNFSENISRLWIPTGTGRYVYTGSRVVHSKQARFQIRNDSGDDVLLDIDVWAKAWED